ncbi:MAG: FAD-dependent oxidoreductase [Cyclobacteriaceae bacterium]|nr:FAD-binding protein [Cytophagales bacterium]HNP78604.1 FAD-dependent oxidoreductase [Cyclobacteriaceae bacterium]
MPQQQELVLTPSEAFDPVLYQRALEEQLGLSATGLAFRLVKRSIDARGRQVVVRLLGEVVSRDEAQQKLTYNPDYQDVSRRPRVVIVGAGPAGLFAALQLIEAGLKPVVVERGKDVRARRRDIAAINKDHIVDPDSNYCFGEGGAGTYSDGKLYTRSTKRGDVRRILEILVTHGATPEILYDAHPHIGTNKLPAVVSAIRERILAAGGEIHFGTRVADLIIRNEHLVGVTSQQGEEISGEAVILATGHSARDIYELLDRRKVYLEVKPFAIGVRVEHAQGLIDRVQYHSDDRGLLPAASYSLVHQATLGKEQRGVFSFCMCPGGFIVPAATAPGEVVVNGMSPSRRDSRFANSGIVTSVDARDFKGYESYGALAGLAFQRDIEQAACRMAGNKQFAPAQLLEDFVRGKLSSSLLDCSYQPGLVSADVGAVFPRQVSEALRQGFKNFGTKVKGYLSNEAQVLGVESRTSSPVRIPRDNQSLEHPRLKGLYPCGEGAGFAGGIVSAAMDGERCAQAVIRKLKG